MKIFSLIVVVSQLLPIAVLAQSSNGDESDHAALSRFPESEIVDFDVSDAVGYQFVLGTLNKPRLQVEAEASRRLSGKLTRITYEIASQFSGAEVIEYFREQVRQRQYSEVFSCEGRGCGSSEYWANDIFQKRILYGPQRNQFYAAIETDPGAIANSHISIYIITRGNRRVYAHLEFLDTENPDAQVMLASEGSVGDGQSLLSSLEADGSVVLPQITFNQFDQLLDDSVLTAVAQALALDTSIQIYIVAHFNGGDSLEQMLQKSQNRADLVRTRLLSLGVSPERLVARGLGPLAPFCNQRDCAQRIEMVLQ